jgi:hypothetical protein
MEMNIAMKNPAASCEVSYRKELLFPYIRSLTPQQAARNALAIRFKQNAFFAFFEIF